MKGEVATLKALLSKTQLLHPREVLELHQAGLISRFEARAILGLPDDTNKASAK